MGRQGSSVNNMKNSTYLYGQNLNVPAQTLITLCELHNFLNKYDNIHIKLSLNKPMFIFPFNQPEFYSYQCCLDSYLGDSTNIKFYFIKTDMEKVTHFGPLDLKPWRKSLKHYKLSIKYGCRLTLIFCYLIGFSFLLTFNQLLP